MNLIRSPQDFGAGLLFVLIGGAGLYFGSELSFGSARQMGPGYFPTIVSWMILVLGLFVAGRSLTFDGQAIERIRLRPILMILLALGLFGFLIAKTGVIVASVLLIFVTAYARPGVRVVETAIFAAALTASIVLVFVYALGQPMPLWWGQ